MATARLAKAAKEVNQYAAPIHAPGGLVGSAGPGQGHDQQQQPDRGHHLTEQYRPSAPPGR
jgi:hypothetical protein